VSRYRHTATARNVLRSLVPVICPPEAAPLADAIVDHMELTFSATPILLRAALSTGFGGYDALSIPRYRRRAHKLSGADADAYYESWVHGTPVHKQFAVMVNQVMSMSCYEQPEMMKAVGYHVDDWMREVTKKRLTVFADDIRRREADILAPDPLRPASKRTKEVA
jgi:hypothetical protein